MQEQTLGEVGHWMVTWWSVMSGIFIPKTIKIWLSLLLLLLLLCRHRKTQNYSSPLLVRWRKRLAASRLS